MTDTKIEAAVEKYIVEWKMARRAMGIGYTREGVDALRVGFRDGYIAGQASVQVRLPFTEIEDNQ